MHPPLKIIDQTDELIAIEWLKEHGFNSYADHMEADLEKPIHNAVSSKSWSWSRSGSRNRCRPSSTSESESKTRSQSKSRGLPKTKSWCQSENGSRTKSITLTEKNDASTIDYI